MEINSASNTNSNPVLDRPLTTRAQVSEQQSAPTPAAPHAVAKDQVTLSPAALKASSAATASTQAAAVAPHVAAKDQVSPSPVALKAASATTTSTTGPHAAATPVAPQAVAKDQVSLSPAGLKASSAASASTTGQQAAQPAALKTASAAAPAARSDNANSTTGVAATADNDQDGDGTDEVSEADNHPVEPPAVKSFVYGTLGLERPEAEPVEAAEPSAEQPTQAPAPTSSDEFYSAGRWLAAAATVGTIISLLA